MNCTHQLCGDKLLKYLGFLDGDLVAANMITVRIMDLIPD